MQVLGTTASHVSFPILTGGTLYTGANHYYRKFTTSGTFTTTAPIEIEYIAIAGGGASGFHSALSGATFRGGGGGAGRYANQTLTIPAGSWDITVGAGGYRSGVFDVLAGFTGVSGTSGWSVSLPGGGKGGNSNNNGTGQAGDSGGSGGGGGTSFKTTGGAGGAATAGTPTGSGFNGGNGSNSAEIRGTVNGAGGGGAGGAGVSSGVGTPGPGISLSGTEWNTIASVPVTLGQGGSGIANITAVTNSGYGGSGSSVPGANGIFAIRYLKSAVGG
jgi:hypothetical protein